MAKVLCSKKEYSELVKIFKEYKSFPKNVKLIFEIVEDLPQIPEDYLYDTETKEFDVYRNKYTGDEIHIVKDPSIYILTEK